MNDGNKSSQTSEATSLQCAEEALPLIKSGRLLDAQQILFRGLSEDPFNPRARILLARVFFSLDQIPFAVRELEQAYRELPDNRYVKNLLERLAPEKVTAAGTETEVQTGSESTIAEAEFDIDVIDLLKKD